MLTAFQTRTIDLPSDSSFAVAMRSQQQADREEQQRIKNLVLNYEAANEPEEAESKTFVVSRCLLDPGILTLYFQPLKSASLPTNGSTSLVRIDRPSDPASFNSAM